jgi:hypothetical protein
MQTPVRTSKGFFISLFISLFFVSQNYRELDRGTAYFHDQALKLWDDSTHGGKTISRQEWVEKVLWAAALYRLLNRVDTFLVSVAGDDLSKKCGSLIAVSNVELILSLTCIRNLRASL